MNKLKKYNVIGIMSGTSVDGIDFAYMETDGLNYVRNILGNSYTYSENYKKLVKRLIKNFKSKNRIDIGSYDEIITRKFLQKTKQFLKENKINPSKVDYIGLSGQTIFHNPSDKISVQLGSGKIISKKLKIKVVSNFRDNDIKNNGQGAPIGAFYHKYICNKFNKKIAMINLGGIANITYVNNNELIAFDLGPANSLIDDFMWKTLKKKFDNNGRLSLQGRLKKNILHKFLNDSYFNLKYPKSLDREYFTHYLKKIDQLSNKDAAYNISILTVYGIKKGIELLNKKIDKIILTGGGRKNLFFVDKIKKILKIKVIDIDKLNHNGDLLEAEAFAYLAIRCVKKLPISIKSTTGVAKPLTGGILYNYK